MTNVLLVTEVRTFVSDYAPNNYLLDGEEFTDSYISLCMDLAVDAYNVLPPISVLTLETFQSKSLLLFGTCWHMFEGKATLLARNTMNYSDGGLQIPIEERFELYRNTASSFKASFDERARALKIHSNMESGWGSVSSDFSTLPLW